MLVNIGGKDYGLNFGWGFLEEINKRIGLTGGGIEFEQGGLVKLDTGFRTKDPVTLVHIIQSATVTERQKPRKKDVQDFIGELVSKGEYREFYEELGEEIKKQPLLNGLMNQMSSQEEELEIQ